MRRHVYFYTYLSQPADVVSRLFAGDPGAWLPPPAEPDDEGWRVVLHADGALPDAVAAREAWVTVGAVTPSGEGLLRRVQWRARTAERLFPVLEADLEVTPLEGRGSQLSLLGTYRPPLSVVGDAGDRMLGHRVAEASVRRFVLDIDARVAEATRSSSA